MDKRTFLRTGAIATAAVIVNPFTLSSCNRAASAAVTTPTTGGAAGKFELPALPYQFAALEPHIDKMTMEIHHDRHHAAYVTNLNKAIEGKNYASMTIDQLVQAVKPEDSAVRNNGGGHYNHSMFWKWMAPNSGGAPKGRIAEFINQKFTSFDKFKEQFNAAATGRFGSGWAWLVVGSNGDLMITSTPNQDNPLMKEIVNSKEYGYPVLGLDVWEHAYYLKYQNKRADYANAFWNLVNWDEVNRQYDMGMQKFGKK
ncbi:MAG: superoxide dismutase [Saprospiraceae bacterium]